MFTTKVGEKTLRARCITFLGKAFRPLPEKFHSIQDTELCWRRRYLDLCMNGETRRRFLFKSQLVREIRRYLEDNGYIEIETPVLIDHPSGATRGRLLRTTMRLTWTFICALRRRRI